MGDNGAFLALPDNGFGTRENSADFLLRVYELRPDFKTRSGGAGTIAVELVFVLRDPHGHIGFPIVADMEFYPGSEIPVHESIRSERLLTGADFDVESFRRVPGGTFYFGDEFGPFLLHTDTAGALLEPPIPLPGVRSPQHPELGDDEPNLPRSGGFEGMALSADGATLFPMLEHPLTGDGAQLNIYAFDLASGRYRHLDPDSASYRYPLDPIGVAVAEFTMWSGEDYLAIERDAGQGSAARLKKVFHVTPFDLDANGFLVKTEIVDLLDVADPYDIGGAGTGRFTFPFETTESLVIVDDSTIGIVNDNNYPFGLGRHVGTGEPDDTEFVLLRIRR